MKELYEAFKIFAKYSTDNFPTSCEHDIMYVHVKPTAVSDEDVAELERLGFDANEDLGNFQSTKFGSA